LSAIPEAPPQAAQPLGSPGRRRNDRTLKLVALLCSVALVTFVVIVVVLRPTNPTSPRTFPSTAPPMVPIGSAAPTFTAPALVGGQPVGLAHWHGTPVILSFFASWCSHCQAELSAVAATAHASAGQVAVVGVDTNDGNGRTALHLLDQAGAGYPVASDPKGTVAALYRVTALPTTYFVGADGKVAGVAFGQLTVADLQRWVRQLTAPHTGGTAGAGR